MVTTGAVRRAKLQSNCHHQQTKTHLFLSYYGLNALPVAQPTVLKHWRDMYHITQACSPQTHWGVFQLCLWPLKAPGYLAGGLPCLSSALWLQYPNTASYRIQRNRYIINKMITRHKTNKHTRCNRFHSVDRPLSPIRMVILQLTKQCTSHTASTSTYMWITASQREHKATQHINKTATKIVIT